MQNSPRPHAKPNEEPTDQTLDPTKPFPEFLVYIQEVFPEVAATVNGYPEKQKQIFRVEYTKCLVKFLKQVYNEKPIEEKRKDAAIEAWFLADTHPNGREETTQTLISPPRPKNPRHFSLALARQLCAADAIVYRFLQDEQAELTRFYTTSFTEREGRRWVPGYSAAFIHSKLNCFRNCQTVLDAVNRLETAGLIRTERTGRFVKPERRTNRKRDIAMWLHVPAPLDRTDPTVTIEAADARRFGLSLGMIVTLFRAEPQTERLSAADLTKRLPLSAATIRKLRKKVPKDFHL